MNHEVVPLQGLKQLANMPLMGHMIHTAHQHVIHEGKSGLHLLDGAIHVALKRDAGIPQPKRQPLVLEQTKRCGNGSVRYICWVDRNLMVSFLRSTFEKTVHPAALAAKSIILGNGYTSGSVTTLSRRKSPHGRQLPSFFCTICKGLAQGDVERWMIPSASNCRNSALAACNFSPSNRRNLAAMGGPVVTI
jgi:hypothetical protein